MFGWLRGKGPEGPANLRVDHFVHFVAPEEPSEPSEAELRILAALEGLEERMSNKLDRIERELGETKAAVEALGTATVNLITATNENKVTIGGLQGELAAVRQLLIDNEIDTAKLDSIASGFDDLQTSMQTTTDAANAALAPPSIPVEPVPDPVIEPTPVEPPVAEEPAPPVEDPPAEEPVADAPVEDAPVADEPVAEEPAPDAPVDEEPQA